MLLWPWHTELVLKCKQPNNGYHQAKLESSHSLKEKSQHLFLPSPEMSRLSSITLWNIKQAMKHVLLCIIMMNHLTCDLITCVLTLYFSSRHSWIHPDKLNCLKMLQISCKQMKCNKVCFTDWCCWLLTVSCVQNCVPDLYLCLGSCISPDITICT